MRLPLILFLSALGFQTLTSVVLPILADEAYYLAWSRSLAMGYFDHPPGIAYWIAMVGGHPRIPGLFASIAEALLLYKSALNLKIAHAPFVPAIFLWTPLALGQNTIATPDQPVALCFCAALWCATLKPSRWVDVGLGTALGLGLWCKSTILWALPGVLASIGLRRALRVVCVTAVLYAPHCVWSFMHGGLPWRFQSSRGFGVGFSSLASLVELLVAQLLLLTPLTGVTLVRRWITIGLQWMKSGMTASTEIEDVRAREVKAPTGIEDVRVREVKAPTGIEDVRAREVKAPTEIEDVRAREVKAPTEIEDVRACEVKAPTEIEDVRACEVKAPTEIEDVRVREVKAPTGIEDVRACEVKALHWDGMRMLWLWSAPILILWALTAIFVRAEANWAALFWPAGSLLVAASESPVKRLLHWAVPCSCGLCLLACVGLRVLPATMGPPRTGERACFDAIGLPIVATRYQEKALFDVEGPEVIYRRAQGHRSCEYDRHPQAALPASYVAVTVPRKGDPGLPCDGQRSLRAVCGRLALFCETTAGGDTAIEE